ncbi:MAG: alginate export family protein [Candidatus Pacebacteria bacterium]|nr:alginate export family protein [Candidatus Paceibacterota bacterium]
MKVVHALKLTVAVMIGMVSLSYGEYTWEYSERVKCQVGGDVRLRLTHFDRNVVSPEWGRPIFGTEDGPALEYIRVRERLWGCVDIDENKHLRIRLVNRWHHFSSNIGPDNNPDDGSSWRFPDEVIIDQLNLGIDNIFGSNWSLTIGRQDVMLGNGMIVLEGTPYDTGRTIYFDGVMATYAKGKNEVKLFGFYNDYKDKTVFINDQNRRLRRGDTWLAGVYWTHKMNSCFNSDLYYMFIDIDDDRPNTAERNHPADENAQLDIIGARVFGSLNPQVDYSLEVAKQRGERMENADFTGIMADARLRLKAKEGTPLAPSLDLEYTYFSGNDPDSNDEFEGWHPAFAEYPIWRDELVPIMLNGNWTNLSQYRAGLNLNLYDSEKVGVRFSGAWAVLLADYGDQALVNAPGGGGGDNIGHLCSGFLDVALKDYSTNISLQASHFEPGNYWLDGQASEWLRFEMVYTF